MKNKNLYIGLGVLAVAGIGYYMWKNKKSDNKRVSNSKLETATSSSEMGATEDEDSSNVTAATGGNRGCPCYGVKANDGFGNPRLLYSVACCKKAKQ